MSKQNSVDDYVFALARLTAIEEMVTELLEKISLFENTAPPEYDTGGDANSLGTAYMFWSIGTDLRMAIQEARAHLELGLRRAKDKSAT